MTRREPTSPAACFEAALNDAREQRVDLLVLAGGREAMMVRRRGPHRRGRRDCET